MIWGQGVFGLYALCDADHENAGRFSNVCNNMAPPQCCIDSCTIGIMDNICKSQSSAKLPLTIVGACLLVFGSFLVFGAGYRCLIPAQQGQSGLQMAGGTDYNKMSTACGGYSNQGNNSGSYVPPTQNAASLAPATATATYVQQPAAQQMQTATASYVQQ